MSDSDCLFKNIDNFGAENISFLIYHYSSHLREPVFSSGHFPADMTIMMINLIEHLLVTLNLANLSIKTQIV